MANTVTIKDLIEISKNRPEIIKPESLKLDYNYDYDLVEMFIRFRNIDFNLNKVYLKKSTIDGNSVFAKNLIKKIIL